MTFPPLPELLAFMLLVLAVSLYGLTVSGHFPSEHRKERLRGTMGTLILALTSLVVLISAGVACWLGWQRLPIPIAVISAGTMVLTAPLLLHPLPDSFIDGRRGLVAFAGLTLALSLFAWSRL